MSKTNQELDLFTALLYAKVKASEQSNIDDGGTSNMDTPIVKLPGFSKQTIENAFRAAKLTPYFEGNVIFIHGACEGQGFRNTAMAEAFRDALKSFGYNAAVDYRID